MHIASSSRMFRTLPWLLGGMLGSVAALAATGEWQSLFDGQSLAGWRTSENPGALRVEAGAIVCDGPRAHLFYEGPVANAHFHNFEFEAEVKTRAGANSGVFFHTRYQERDWPAQGYEVQVHNAATGEGGYRENKLTGSLYGVRNLHRPIVPDGEWFRLRIAVRGPRIAVHVNDVQVVDYLETRTVEGGAVRTAAGGTFALQCHDPASRVWFRNVRVRVLPDDPGAAGGDPEAYRLPRGLAALHGRNYPVIDLHTHLKGGLTLDDVVQRYYRTGINAGVAVNGGLGFAVTNDAGLDQALRELRHPLTYTALQAEGREWVELFSLPAVARFDYVFTDAMTLRNPAGQRMRLWIREEVEVGDPEAFMEHLVATTVAILDREPVDLWANPTYLPEVLAPEYDRLWTAERRQRVIAAAVRNRVAIEINDRLQLPRAVFLREARAAGATFTFGTNNGGREDLGVLEYGVRMVRECDLRWQDFWVPGREPSRTQRAVAAGRTVLLER